MMGERFGRLVVIACLPGGKMHVLCDCDNDKIVAKKSLTSGATRSCGCLASEMLVRRNRKHGHARRGRWSGTYISWVNMLGRVDHPQEWKVQYYAGKGIAICDRWRTFENFLADMGDRPFGTSLDRIDNNRGYQPGNCRWATKAEQQRNTSQTIIVEYRGRKMCLTDAAALAGVPYSRAHSRLARGCTVDEALA